MRLSEAAPFALALGLSLIAAPSLAKDTWTTPFDGVRRLKRVETSPNEVIHAVVVDLASPGIHFTSTATDQRKRTTSSFQKLVGAQIAVNGDFFSYSTYATSGLAAGKGAAWSDTKDDATWATFAFDTKTRVEFSAAKELVAFDPEWMHGVVSGRPWLVTAGTLNTFSPNSSLCAMRHPRTALGLSEDRKTLIAAVVDGRTTAAVGMTCAELGTLMQGLGAFDAVNLDGGGSSTMVLSGLGVVNSPSDGSERTVANHLGIFAPKFGTVGAFHGVVHENGDPSKTLAGATVSIADVGEAIADDAGAYSLAALPGTYTIDVKHAGYDDLSVLATLGAGEKKFLDLALVPTPPPDADGDGVPDAEDKCPAEAGTVEGCPTGAGGGGGAAGAGGGVAAGSGGVSSVSTGSGIPGTNAEASCAAGQGRPAGVGSIALVVTALAWTLRRRRP